MITKETKKKHKGLLITLLRKILW